MATAKSTATTTTTSTVIKLGTSPNLNTATTKVCPHCKGLGRVAK